MATQKVITARYSGEINSKTIYGNGSLHNDNENKIIEGGIDFSNSELTNEYVPLARVCWNSLLSVLCCFGCGSSGIWRMADESKGDATSKRTIEVYQEGSIVSEFTIDTYLSKVNDNYFRASVQMIGYYNGPKDFEKPTGYELSLTPKTSNKLAGEFLKTLKGSDNKDYNIKHTHEYIFHDGTYNDLPDELIHILEIDYEKSFVSNEDKYFYLFGTSEVQT